MKKLIFLVALFTVSGCKKSDKNYPIEIPFSEYLLEETSCQWNSFEFDKIIIVNSDEELDSYISCSEENYPEVDFSEHSLLLAQGWVNSYPAEVMKIQLQKVSDNEHALFLSIRPGFALTPGHWIISITTPKLSKNTFVSLNVQQIPIPL
ncbi:MAG: hypothetical protein LBM67_06530 [Lentimicrobiaceae bacterium]|jgi:hypothetical protein|nr:hypothetical protein [Lentimicrobiaceae bacterium]